MLQCTQSFLKLIPDSSLPSLSNFKAPQCILHQVQVLQSDIWNQGPFYHFNSHLREAHLGHQEHINEVQSLGLSLGLEEVINILIREGTAPLLDDGICEVMH